MTFSSRLFYLLARNDASSSVPSQAQEQSFPCDNLWMTEEHVWSVVRCLTLSVKIKNYLRRTHKSGWLLCLSSDNNLTRLEQHRWLDFKFLGPWWNWSSSTLFHSSTLPGDGQRSCLLLVAPGCASHRPALPAVGAFHDHPQRASGEDSAHTHISAEHSQQLEASPSSSPPRPNHLWTCETSFKQTSGRNPPTCHSFAIVWPRKGRLARRRVRVCV